MVALVPLLVLVVVKTKELVINHYNGLIWCVLPCQNL